MSIDVPATNFKDGAVAVIDSDLTYDSIQIGTVILGPHDEYTVTRVVGVGAQSIVCEVQSDRYHTSFAAKIMFVRDDLVSEVTALRRLDHPAIVRCYDAFCSGEVLVLVLELCRGGSLKDELVNGRMERSRFLSIATSLVSGLRYAHAHGVAHRDVKPSNILFRDAERQEPILVDFGFSSISAAKEVKSGLGTLVLMSPECFWEEFHDPQKSDIWALGITFYWMLQGHPPYACVTDDGCFLMDENELVKVIMRGSVELSWCKDAELRNILEKMLVLNVRERITAADLLDLPVFQLVRESRTMKGLMRKQPRSVGINLKLMIPRSGSVPRSMTNPALSATALKERSLHSARPVPVPKLEPSE